MPNATVPAAATGLPILSRLSRRLFLGSSIAVAAAPVAVAVTLQSPAVDPFVDDTVENVVAEYAAFCDAAKGRPLLFDGLQAAFITYGCKTRVDASTLRGLANFQARLESLPGGEAAWAAHWAARDAAERKERQAEEEEKRRQQRAEMDAKYPPKSRPPRKRRSDAGVKRAKRTAAVAS